MRLGNAVGIAAIAVLGLPLVAQAQCTAAFTPNVSPLNGVDPSAEDCVYFDDGSGPALFLTGNMTTAGAWPSRASHAGTGQIERSGTATRKSELSSNILPGR